MNDIWRLYIYQHNMKRIKPNPAKRISHHVGKDRETSSRTNLTAHFKLLNHL